MVLTQDVGSFPMVYGRKNLFLHSKGIVPLVFVHELHLEHFPLLMCLKILLWNHYKCSCAAVVTMMVDRKNMSIQNGKHCHRVRASFPRSSLTNSKYHGNDSLGFSSRGWWETIPRLAITPSWLRPKCKNQIAHFWLNINQSEVLIKAISKLDLKRQFVLLTKSCDESM